MTEPPPRSPTMGPEGSGPDGAASSASAPRSPWPAGWRDRSAGVANGPALKAVLIGALVVGLLLPLALVRDLIAEREGRQRAAVASIAADWSGPQAVAGPVLAVPYRLTTRDDRGRAREVEETAWVLPETLTADLALTPETRRRGLFEAAVYTAAIELAAEIALPETLLPDHPDARIDWDRARLVLGVADPRGIEPGLALTVDGTPRAAGPLTGRALVWPPGFAVPEGGVTDIGPGGVSVPLPDLAEAVGGDPAGRRIAVGAAFRLKGAQALAVVPVGAETAVTAAAPWPDPGFAGAFLPDTRSVTPDGFAAEWRLGQFGRGFGTVVAGADETELARLFASAAFGLRLLEPVDAYRQTQRMTKYGVLVVLFTYLALYLYEVVGGRRIHPVQYGLVGLALVVFYLLLLSLAERLGFTPAYAVGATAVVAQVGLYAAAVLGRRPGGGLAALLAGLYGALWVLMRLEDTALVVGSVALFLGLSAVMWATRRIDWYRAGPAPG